MLRMRTFIIVVGLMLAQVANADVDWGLALTGPHRAEGNAARNEARHPRETLEFFWASARDDCLGGVPRWWLVYGGAGTPVT